MAVGYKMVGEWRQIAEGAACTQWRRDLMDHHGRIYVDGAEKVALTQEVTDLGGQPVKGKTFKGETAWMGADRLFEDIERYHRHNLNRW